MSDSRRILKQGLFSSTAAAKILDWLRTRVGESRLTGSESMQRLQVLLHAWDPETFDAMDSDMCI